MNKPEAEKHKVELVGPDGTRTTGVFTLDSSDDACTLRLDYQGKQLAATEADYFEALCTIRRQLEAQGLTPVCYGASRRCFPSGMARDRAAGLKLYKLELGRSLNPVALVSLLGRGSDVEPVSVAEQRAFYQEWVSQQRR